MMSTRRLRIAVGLVLLTFLLAACGGGTPAGRQPNTNYGDSSASNNAQAPAAAGSSSASQPADSSGYDYGSATGSSANSGQSATPQVSAGGSGGASAATPTTSNPDAKRFAITPDKSSATYHAKQKTFVPGLSSSVNGTTHDVTGTIFFDPRNPSRSEVDKISVNVGSLDSGTSLRDQRLHREFLESGKFPTATLETTHLSGLPTSPYADGKELKFKIVGNLTLHGVTKQVSFDATAKVSGNTLSGDAKTSVKLTDFGMTVPDLLNFVKVQNEVGIEMSLVATRS